MYPFSTLLNGLHPIKIQQQQQQVEFWCHIMQFQFVPLVVVPFRSGFGFAVTFIACSSENVIKFLHKIPHKYSHASLKSYFQKTRRIERFQRWNTLLSSSLTHLHWQVQLA